MKFAPIKLTILGCYAATPRTLSNPTSQVLEMANHTFLIDCAEGTQVQLRKLKVGFAKINHIFISHLHGDHCYGLIGLVSTFMLFNRQHELHIYGPKGIKELILFQLRLSESFTPYPLHFHELTAKEPEVIFEDARIKVSTIPLEHRVYTNGFRFDEKPGLRPLNRQKADDLGVPPYCFDRLKRGESVTLDDGRVIDAIVVTDHPLPTRTFAYCSDTQFSEQVAEYVKGATFLYHEATFLESEQDKAQKTKHSTAKEAAEVARLAGVDTLILGHYSTRYGSIAPFKEEAEQVFEKVLLADDGEQFEW